MISVGVVRSSDCDNSEAEINIQMESLVIQGFPIIVKVIAKGPQVVPDFSLFDNSIDIDVFFESRNDDRIYSIASGTQTHLDGRTRAKPCCQRYAYLQPEKRQEFLLEINSLLPANFQQVPRTTMDDVPPGEYRVHIRFVSSTITSNTVDVVVLKPTATEQEFLRGFSGSRASETSIHVDWTKILKSCNKARGFELSRIRPEARKQLGFHVLLSSLLQSGGPSKEELDMIKVPKFLSNEKSILILQARTYKNNEKQSVAIPKAIIEGRPELRLWADSNRILLQQWVCGGDR